MTDDIVTRLREIPCNAFARVRIEDAADEIERLRRNTGCARNQRSTQFCAEALDAQREVEALREQLRLANIDNFNTTAEVDRLRTQLEMWQDGNIMAESHRDELVRNADEFRETLTELRQRVETLTAERDEARRFICDLSWEDPRVVAMQLGWDCYKEAR